MIQLALDARTLALGVGLTWYDSFEVRHWGRADCLYLGSYELFIPGTTSHISYVSSKNLPGYDVTPVPTLTGANSFMQHHIVPDKTVKYPL